MRVTIEKLPEFTKKFLDDISNEFSNIEKALLIELSGNLGAGKTTFTQHLAKHLNIEEKITSPTFVLMKRYPINFGQFKNLFHIDAYRIEDISEILILNLTEIFADKKNLVLVEWPEKISEALPKEKIQISFEIDEEDREISISKNV